MTEVLDETDLNILRELQKNCRITNKELAEAVHRSTTPVFERQRRLEKLGYIRQYCAIVDADKIDRGFVVYCNVTMKQINYEIAERFRQTVLGWSEVGECYNVSGSCDYMMKVYAKSMRQYQEFVLNRLGQVSEISRVESIFVMDTLKQTYGVAF